MNTQTRENRDYIPSGDLSFMRKDGQMKNANIPLDDARLVESPKLMGWLLRPYGDRRGPDAAS